MRGHGAMGRYEELCAGDSCCHCSSGTVFDHEFWSSVRCRTTKAYRADTTSTVAVGCEGQSCVRRSSCAYFWLRKSGIACATAAATGKAIFAIAAANVYGVNTRMCAINQSAARAASFQRVGVGKLDPLLPAVGRKPTMTANVKPKSISWACHKGPAR